MSEENPHRYGTPEFGAWRRQSPLREAQRQAASAAEQATHNLTSNESSFKERQARLAAEKAERQKVRDQFDDQRLSVERAQMRAQYLLQHGASTGYEFDQLWKSDLRESLLLSEQAATLENEIAYQRRRMGGAG
jgi:hypothetical protein